MTVGGRAGFTLVETLVVSVLSVFLLLALYATVVSSSRTYALRESWARGGQMNESGAAALFRDLREISPGDDDLIRMESRGLEIRAPRRLALVCEVLDVGTRPRVGVRWVGAALQVGDSVRVFFDHDPAIPGDDEWHTGVVAEVEADRSCVGPGAAHELTLDGLPEDVPRSGLLPGAPIRSFVHVTYDLRSRDELGELVRAEGGGRARPVLTALEPDSGAHFAYLDARGRSTDVASEVAQVEVTLRRSASGDRRGGAPGIGPVTTRIHARN